jgi:hypothetical protein
MSVVFGIELVKTSLFIALFIFLFVSLFVPFFILIAIGFHPVQHVY